MKPSDFLRKKRPEYYSDTKEKDEFKFRREELEYFFDSITSRNETNKFEAFCRKLCQRIICPNLLPPTGPEGGGDSKADTETYAVSDEILDNCFIGLANSGRESWAFAISAKEKWKDKIRSDVKGLIETGRNFDKIFFVSSRSIRSKDLAAVKLELFELYGVPIEILDRTWIVECITEKDCGDIAHYHMGVGERNEKRVVGIGDYGRQLQLTELENDLSKIENYGNCYARLVEDAIVAVKLSREMEKPRFETDGRIDRAIRLANKYGTYHQKLDAKFQQLRTYVWWYDDIISLNNSFEEFATLSYKSESANDVRDIIAFVSILLTAIKTGQISEDITNLKCRIDEFRSRLVYFATQKNERPNNALEAESQLCMLDLNLAINDCNVNHLGSIWKRMGKILDESDGLAEFDPNSIADCLEAVGEFQKFDTDFDELYEKCAQKLGQRKGDVAEGLALLQRAEQLKNNNSFELIRIAGKAASKLCKSETSLELIRSLYILGNGYRNAGLLWAARGSFIHALAKCFIEASRDSYYAIKAIPILKYWAWTAFELKKIPEVIEAYDILNWYASTLELDDNSTQKTIDDLMAIDCALASVMFKLSEKSVQALLSRTKALDDMGLLATWMALIYRGGHQEVLKDLGLPPGCDNEDDITLFFKKVANQPATKRLLAGDVFYEKGDRHTISTFIFGMEIEIFFPDFEVAIVVAEALAASIEALFATVNERSLVPNFEKLVLLINIERESEKLFTIDPLNMICTINWSPDLSVTSHETFEEVANAIREIIYSIAPYAFSGDVYAAILDFHKKDNFHNRLSLLLPIHNAYHRIFNKYVCRIEDIEEDIPKKYKLMDVVNNEKNVPIKVDLAIYEKTNFIDNFIDEVETQSDSGFNHRSVEVSNIINEYTWERAQWSGTGFAVYQDQSIPPRLVLIFKNEDAARTIFENWRLRFGEIDINESIYVSIINEIDKWYPANYKLLITSGKIGASKSKLKKTLVTCSKFNLMKPNSTKNLDMFIDAYRKFGGYVILPGVVSKTAPFRLIEELGISKRNLKIMRLKDVRKNDIEMTAFPEKFKN